MSTSLTSHFLHKGSFRRILSDFEPTLVGFSPDYDTWTSRNVVPFDDRIVVESERG